MKPAAKKKAPVKAKAKAKARAKAPAKRKAAVKRAVSDEKRGRGRPTNYKPEYADQAFKLCLLGATDKQLADFFGVTEQTINNWKVDFPEFFESLQKGKDVADAEVAHSLYKRAVGMEVPDTHFSSYEGIVTETPYKKVLPPDVAASFIWLKNRQPAMWRDRHEVQLEAGDSLLDAIMRGRQRATAPED